MPSGAFWARADVEAARNNSARQRKLRIVDHLKSPRDALRCRLGYQPVRGVRWRKSLAAATLVTRMAAPSYSILRPARSATTPRSITSVSFAAYSNGEEACVAPFAALTQFIS